MNKLKIWAFLLASGCAFVAPVVRAQVVTPPTLDSATLHARLARGWSADGKAMPADRVALDGMYAQKNYLELIQRLGSAPNAQAILLDMNWEQAKIFDGGGFLISLAYMRDLWRFGNASGVAEADQLKQSAAMMLLYNIVLLQTDGVKCSDPSAAGHRMDQLAAQARPIIIYLRGLPADDKGKLGNVALAVELATAPLRVDDEVLCSGGAAEMAHNLAANGNKPLPRVPSPPGIPGKSYAVPADPHYSPQFVDAAVWRPKQEDARNRAPQFLTQLMTKLGDVRSPPAPR